MLAQADVKINCSNCYGFWAIDDFHCQGLTLTILTARQDSSTLRAKYALEMHILG